MPAFHGTTIGSGVVIVTPTTVGTDNWVLISKGDGTSQWADISAVGAGVFDVFGSAATVQGNLDTHEADAAIHINWQLASQGTIHGTNIDVAYAYTFTAIQTFNLDVNLAGGARFGAAETVYTAASITLDLKGKQHVTIDLGTAGQNVAVSSITNPDGPSAGTIIVKQGITPRNITSWPAEVQWIGTEPDWDDPAEASSVRLISWRRAPADSKVYLVATDKG